MNLSALIFVALAAAWGAYLIPKALKHHDEVDRSRAVENFSDRMRVVARREPVSARKARLVVPGHDASVSAGLNARRDAARRAARRRRNVLAVIVVALCGTAGAATSGLFSPYFVAIPAAVLVAWLVACRLMVKKERSVWVPSTRPAKTPKTPKTPKVEPADDDTETIAVITDDAQVDIEIRSEAVSAVLEAEGDTEDSAGRWDPVPVTLPTYVDKPAAARRTVQKIDLDSTGVWSSGRSEVDSALAREAEAQAKLEAEVAKAADEANARRRASGA